MAALTEGPTHSQAVPVRLHVFRALAAVTSGQRAAPAGRAEPRGPFPPGAGWLSGVSTWVFSVKPVCRVHCARPLTACGHAVRMRLLGATYTPGLLLLLLKIKTVSVRWPPWGPR